jgi:hypothetical protein
MAAKQLIFHEHARQALARGAFKVAQAVGCYPRSKRTPRRLGSKVGFAVSN